MMFDQTASSQLPADSAPASSGESGSFVPFKDRDFRAASRQTPTKSSSVPPVTEEQVPESDDVEVNAEAPARLMEVAAEKETPASAEASQADDVPDAAEALDVPETVKVPAAEVLSVEDIEPLSESEDMEAPVTPVDAAVEEEEMPSSVEASSACELPPAGELPEAAEALDVPESVEAPVAEVLPADDIEPLSESEDMETPVTAESAAVEEQETPSSVEASPADKLPEATETPELPEPVEVKVTHELPAEEAEASPVSAVTSTEINEVAAADVVAVVETAETGEVAVEPGEEVENGFAGLGLNDFVLQAVIDGGYQQPTEIQAQIIPHVLAGQDVLAQSQTGSGKTAAFALPILSRIETGKRASRHPQVLVLAPTRELAIQVSNSFSVYGASLPGFRVATIYGGQSYDAQFRQLKRGVQVVVGTPGRVIDHVKRGTLDLSELGCLVLDEADEMLNMGFLDDVRFVLEHTPDDRQVALFSATLPAPIRAIAEDYLHDPARVTIKRKTMTADSIRQRALFVPARNKMEALKRLLEAEEKDGVIIFTKTREATVTVAEQLQQEGLATVALNGDMPQRVRERTIEQLKNGQLDILVATDVAARGLDVARVSHVINYDPPNDTESYIHRVGRTGRAGRKGEAIILLSRSQRGRLRQIERATRQTIEVIDLPTADDINAARARRFVQRIAETAAGEDLQHFEKMIEEYARESETSMLRIAAALAHLGQQGRPFFVDELSQGRRDRQSFDDDRRGNRRFDRDRQDSARGGDDRRPRRRDSESAPVEPGMQRYRIAVGWQDGVKPGNIVGAVANEGGIDGDSIGAIRIYSSWSTIDLPEGIPSDVCETLRTTRVAGRPLQLRPYTDEPDASRKRPRQFGDQSRGKKPFSGRRGGPGGGKAGKRPYGKKHGAAGRSGGRPGRDNRRRRQG